MTSPPSPMISVKELVKRFGPLMAVDGISFDVEKGEVLGFLGPNGAGKSTTMKMITGFLSPTSGSVSVCGFDVDSLPLEARRSVGYLPEGAPAYSDMTPLAFLEFVASVRGFTGDEANKAVDRAADRTNLGNVLYQPIETLSKGFKRRVGLAQAILHDPPVLIMDEPTDGLDPNQKHAVRGLIAEMAAEKAIIISTHILEEVEAVCTRAMIIDQGKIVADGTPAELTAKSKRHNAVTIALPEELGEAPSDALKKIDGVADVVLEKGTHGETRFTLLPKDGAILIEKVSGHAASAGWDVKALYVEEGRLDEVFRTLTTPDADLAGRPS